MYIYWKNTIIDSSTLHSNGQWEVIFCTKQLWMVHLTSPKRKNACMSKSRVKKMLILLFFAKGVIQGVGKSSYLKHHGQPDFLEKNGKSLKNAEESFKGEAEDHLFMDPLSRQRPATLYLFIGEIPTNTSSSIHTWLPFSINMPFWNFFYDFCHDKVYNQLLLFFLNCTQTTHTLRQTFSILFTFIRCNSIDTVAAISVRYSKLEHDYV